MKKWLVTIPDGELPTNEKKMCFGFYLHFSGPVCKHTMITISHVILFKYSNHSAAPHNTVCNVLLC